MPGRSSSYRRQKAAIWIIVGATFFLLVAGGFVFLISYFPAPRIEGGFAVREAKPRDSVVARPDLEEQTRAIASELRCVVCENLSVADSPSELAQQMRAVIRELLQAGKSPHQIKNYFVSKYGDWVLLPHKRDEAARQRRWNDFVRKYGVQELVEDQNLFGNPFLYQGKTVAVRLSFLRMITATSAAFHGDGIFVVSNIPTDTYRSPRNVGDLLAVRVVGMTELKGLPERPAPMQVPSLRFVGIHFCQDWGCSDILKK